MAASTIPPLPAHEPGAPVLAAIDVGTNAVRLEIARPSAGGRFETIHQEREPVRLGHGLASTGEIRADAAQRLVETLRRYATACDRHRARLRAVATSALREAQNRDLVVRRIRDETRIELEVISGGEEARLACLGALLGSSAAARALCIDVGGGSTEVVAAIGDQPIDVWSLPLGALTLSERFDTSGAIEGGRLARLVEHTRATIARALPGAVTGYPPRAIACSGSARAVIQFAATGGRTYATAAELAGAVDGLVAMGPRGRAARFEAGKADIVVAAAVVLDSLARRLGLEAIRPSNHGLRHGLIVDLHRRGRPLEVSPLSRGCHPSVTALP